MTIKGYLFDAYGTLFDVHAAVRQNAAELGETGQRLSEIWRTKQLEYSWVRSLMGSYSDFWRLTEDALDFAMKVTGVDDPAMRERLLEAYWTLDAYEDVRPTLERLRASQARTGILSNGSPDMLQAAIDHAGIGDLVDTVLSVDAIKVFKTSPDVYRMATDAWKLAPAEISLQSSNRWDIAGAVRFGIKAVWINRSNAPDEYPNYPPDKVVSSLADL